MTTISIRPLVNPTAVYWHMDDVEDDVTQKNHVTLAHINTPNSDNNNSIINTEEIKESADAHPHKTVEIQDELVSPSSITSIKSSTSYDQLFTTTNTAETAVVSDHAVVPLSEVQEMVPEHILTPSEIVVPLTEDSGIPHAAETNEAEMKSIDDSTTNAKDTIDELSPSVAVGIATPSEIEQPSTAEVPYERLPSETSSDDTTKDEVVATEINTLPMPQDGAEEANPLIPALVNTTTINGSDSEHEVSASTVSPVVVMNSFMDKEYTPVSPAKDTPSADIGIDSTVDEGFSQSSTPYSSAFSSPNLSPRHAKQDNIPSISAPKVATTAPVVRASRLTMLIKQHEEAITKAKEVQPSTKK